MAWFWQNSLHLKQQQMWLLYGYTRPSFFTKTPLGHLSTQTQLKLQRSGSMYTPACTDAGRLTSIYGTRSRPAPGRSSLFFTRQAGTCVHAVPGNGRDNRIPLTWVIIRCPDKNCGIVPGHAGRVKAGDIPVTLPRAGSPFL